LAPPQSVGRWRASAERAPLKTKLSSAATSSAAAMNSALARQFHFLRGVVQN